MGIKDQIKKEQEAEAIRLGGENLLKLCTDLKECKDLKAKSEATIKSLNKVKEELEESIVLALDALGMPSVKYVGVGHFIKSTQDNPRITDSEKAFKYLRSVGAGSLIKETVNPQTLRSWFKEWRSSIFDNLGIEIMDHEAEVDPALQDTSQEQTVKIKDCIEVYRKQIVQVRKA